MKSFSYSPSYHLFLPLVLFFVLIISSCTKDEIKTPSWVQDQIVQLKKSNLRLQKHGQINQNKDQTIVEHPNWSKELEIFESIHLDSAALSTRFDLKRTSQEKGDITSFYVKKEGLKSKIDSMSVVRNGQKLVDIEAFEAESKMFYGSDKYLHLTFTPEGLLSTYEIKGKQSLIFQATEDFALTCLVR